MFGEIIMMYIIFRFLLSFVILKIITFITFKIFTVNLSDFFLVFRFNKIISQRINIINIIKFLNYLILKKIYECTKRDYLYKKNRNERLKMTKYIEKEIDRTIDSLELYFVKTNKSIVKYKFTTNEIVINRIERHIKHYDSNINGYKIELIKLKEEKEKKSQRFEKISLGFYDDFASIEAKWETYKCILCYEKI